MSPVTQPFREPRSFAGQAGEDVDDWLTHYERVSRYNRWDSVAKLANVVFFLTETALLWYENHEDTLTTWERFVEELKLCFGDFTIKKKTGRADTCTESPDCGRDLHHVY